MASWIAMSATNRANPSIAWSSLCVLVAANLVPLHEVVTERWTISEVIALFWLENLAIGVLHWAKLLSCNPDKRPHSRHDKELIGLFPLFYGLFCLFQGVALVAAYFVIEFPDGTLAQQERFTRDSGMGGFQWALAALLASQGYGFVREFLRGGGRRRETIGTLGMGPFGRVVLMLLVLVGGGLVAAIAGQPIWALIVLVVLKLAGELVVSLWRNRTTAGCAP
jgi:hypothetical protein